MTLRDDILQALTDHPQGLTDSELAARFGKSPPHVNLYCRRLADDGRVRRDSSRRPLRNVLVSNAPVVAAVVNRAPDERPTAMQDDPLWEGNVQHAIIVHLITAGWKMLSVADTESQARGIDIEATRDGTRLLIEVKGYPSTTYARGERAGQPKPTPPTVQAHQWLAGALLKALRTRGAHPEAQVAIGLPDVPRYRSLLSEIDGSLSTLGIVVFLVHADGSVSEQRGAHAAS